MRRHIATLLVPLAASSVLVLWLAAAPIAGAGGGCHGDVEMPPSSTGATTEIKLMPCAFAPTVTQVATGASVTFFNGPGYTHLITGANRSWGSPDAEVPPGGKVTYTFAKAGIYPYACAIHSGMSGVIVVGDLASASAGGTAPGTTTTGGAAPAVTGAAAPVTTTAPASSSPTGTVALIVASALAGAVLGAATIWLLTRRRTASSEDEVRGIA